MSYLELKIPPVIVTAVFMLLISLTGKIIPLAYVGYVGTAAGELLATLLFALGIILIYLGVRGFKQAKTTVHPMTPEQTSTIVATGIYRFSRNPMYLGMLFMVLSLAVSYSAVSGYLWAITFVVYMNQFQIKPEERSLSLKFGSEYSEYQQKVRRWL